MLRRVCIGLACFMLVPAWAQTEAAPAEQGALQEQILVVGQRPGPGLWKISKGDNVLWVFGTYAPLPVKMTWRAQQVEAILAQSQEYLAPPSSGSTVGVLRGLTLLPHVIGFRKNPDGARLREVVAPEVYARWLVLKAKYLGNNDDVERERPFFAAERLYRAALQQAGLTTIDEVADQVEKMVRKTKIKITSSHVRLDIDDPAAAIKEFKAGSMDDAACFAKTLERLETDLDAMRVRANAWSRGDLSAIGKLDFADRDAACKSAMQTTRAVSERIEGEGLERRMRKLWLEAAERALATNRSTFAMLKVRYILAGDDLVAALQAKGYRVEAPE
jgi:hypothetical protein